MSGGRQCDCCGPGPCAKCLGADLAGVSEAAAIVGVSKQRIRQLVTDGRFPAPIADLKATPVWRGADLRAYVQARSTKPGRPPVVASVGEDPE